jgi:hypothetical protein
MQPNVSSSIIALNENDKSKEEVTAASQSNNVNEAQSSSLMTRLIKRGECTSILGLTMIGSLLFIVGILAFIGYVIYVYGYNNGDWHVYTSKFTHHNNPHHEEHNQLIGNLD